MKYLTLPFLLSLCFVLPCSSLLSIPSEHHLDHSEISAFHIVQTTQNLQSSIVCEDIVLEISITPPFDALLTCDDNPITLYAEGSSSNGSYTISWLNQIGQSVLVVSEPGTYTAIITDVASGCTATASSQIELIDNIPLVDAGPDNTISCLFPCINLSGIIDGVSSVLPIKWTGPNGFCSNALEPVICEPGDYILSVYEQNGGCTVYDTVTITEVYSNLSTFITESLCPGTCVNFGGDEFCESGNYELVFESWLNCDSIIYLSINEIDVAAHIEQPDTLDCLAEQIELNGLNSTLPGGSFFYWNTTDGHFTETPVSLSPEIDEPGTYILYINATADCIMTDTIIVFADKTEPLINAGEDTQLDCPNQVAIINGVMDTTLTSFDLNWSGPDNYSSDDLESEVNQVGLYTLKVTNLQNGCHSNDDVYVGPPAVVTIDLSTENTCWNQNKGKVNITLTDGGQAPYSYSLDGENYQSDTSFQELASGTYTLYWKDAFQCGGETQISIPEIPQIQTQLDPTYHICTDTYTSLNAAANINELQTAVSYLWSNDSTDPLLHTNQVGHYWVDISNKCETLRQHTEVVNDYSPAKENVYVPSAFSPNGDLINDLFLPFLKHDLIHYEIKIYDRRGSLMFSSEDPTEGWDGTIKGQEAHSGVYAWWIEYIVSTCNDSRDHGFLKGDLTLLR